MKTQNRILITGATGFVGSHLARRLVKEGFRVGIIKRENSDIGRIKDFLDRITNFDVDLRNTDKVSKAISHFKPHAVFHLATYYTLEHNSYEISSMIDSNVLGTINLLEACREIRVKLFVNTSSCFVYKESKNKLRENESLVPLNLYALTKLQAEQACTFYSKKYNLTTVTFRLFPPYGPADHQRRLIPYVIKSLLEKEKLKLTTGRQKWDFVYVGDIVDAYFKLLSISGTIQQHEIFNIGTGNAISVQDVVHRVNGIIGAQLEPDWGAIPHRENEIWFICADISKAKNFLKWQPKVQILREGLEYTVDWYKNFFTQEGKWNKKLKV